MFNEHFGQLGDRSELRATASYLSDCLRESLEMLIMLGVLRDWLAQDQGNTEGPYAVEDRCRVFWRAVGVAQALADGERISITFERLPPRSTLVPLASLAMAIPRACYAIYYGDKVTFHRVPIRL